MQDHLLFTSLYDITLNVTELGDGNRSIVLSGEATPQVYEQVSDECTYNYYYSTVGVMNIESTIIILHCIYVVLLLHYFLFTITAYNYCTSYI